MPIYDYKCDDCGRIREVFTAPSPSPSEKMMLPCRRERDAEAPLVLCNHTRQVPAPYVVIPTAHKAAA